jgi:hypothetical protein
MTIEDLKVGDHGRYAGREVVVVHVGPLTDAQRRTRCGSPT